MEGAVPKLNVGLPLLDQMLGHPEAAPVASEEMEGRVSLNLILPVHIEAVIEEEVAELEEGSLAPIVLGRGVKRSGPDDLGILAVDALDAIEHGGASIYVGKYTREWKTKKGRGSTDWTRFNR